MKKYKVMPHNPHTDDRFTQNVGISSNYVYTQHVPISSNSVDTQHVPISSNSVDTQQLQ